MAEKRGLVLTLVIGTVVIFVGLVWAISTYLPININASPSPTFTADAPRVAMNCASPIAFWKEHPELYPLQLVIGGQVYKAGDLKGIFSGQTDDLAAKLSAQLTAAYLNILSGADQSYIESTIFEAYGWVVQHPTGSQVDDSALGEGTRLFNLLEAYNLGLTGVKPCETGLITSTEPRSKAQTVTVTFTVTPSQTETATPSETPSPTNYPTEPFSTVSAPSRTPSPTIRNTQQPALTPTNTTLPTNTTAPPTATTESPPITSTWTPRPLPTDTWTPRPP
jgi:hypothetical protein